MPVNATKNYHHYHHNIIIFAACFQADSVGESCSLSGSDFSDLSLDAPTTSRGQYLYKGKHAVNDNVSDINLFEVSL